MHYTIAPLISGGIMLTYHCTNACRHCLYRCTPRHANRFMSEERIDQLFAALARERELSGVHLAGGEATCDWDRLVYALGAAQRFGVAIDYLETNVGWCVDETSAEAGFARLQEAGLRAVLISASLFHNEFIPLRQTRIGIETAQKIFGTNQVIIWTPTVYQRMRAALREDRTHTLAESCRALGLDPATGELWRLHSYLTPGGRAAEVLSAGLDHQPVEAFAGERCDSTLARTGHFHIAPDGALFTGQCPGISIASIDDLHPRRTAAEAPAYALLAQEGPCGLVRAAGARFVPASAGYISKCHLCLEVRKCLAPTGEWPDLGTPDFYGAEGASQIGKAK